MTTWRDAEALEEAATTWDAEWVESDGTPTYWDWSNVSTPWTAGSAASTTWTAQSGGSATWVEQ
jgi:hypothetical protein